MAEVLYVGGPKSGAIEYCPDEGPAEIVNVQVPTQHTDPSTGETSFAYGGRKMCTYHRELNSTDEGPRWLLVASDMRRREP